MRVSAPLPVAVRVPSTNSGAIHTPAPVPPRSVMVSFQPPYAAPPGNPAAPAPLLLAPILMDPGVASAVAELLHATVWTPEFEALARARAPMFTWHCMDASVVVLKPSPGFGRPEK